ncbi:MAG: helix-turn-helix transcriptional regulator, partial [Planctomycetales bacterium]
MIAHAFALVDQHRLEQFQLIGSTQRLLCDFDAQLDESNIAWATTEIDGHRFGFTWLASNWAFDPLGRERRRDEYDQRLAAVKNAAKEDHRRELTRIRRRLRFGRLSERLLWFLHAWTLRTRASLLYVPDYMLAAAAWGSSPPRTWRSDLRRLVESFTWIHVGDDEVGFGTDTALVTHAALLDKTNNFCPDDCPARGRRHGHFLVNLGQGFLGELEQCRHEVNDGVRSYAWTVTGKKKSTVTLKKTGKTGRLVSAFLPAKLGAPAACGNLTPSQHGLLQAIVRETTRRPDKDREPDQFAEVVRGNNIPGIAGKRSISCTLLASNRDYVGFNGNKRMKGRGYKIPTWLAKSGYPDGDFRSFLLDLQTLTQVLDLLPVAIAPADNRAYSLEEFIGRDSTVAGRRQLRQWHLRLYTKADYVDRWSRFFGGEDDAGEIGGGAAHVGDDDRTAGLREKMTRYGMTRRDLAGELDKDRSFISKTLNGKKPWPKGLLDQAAKVVEGFGLPDLPPPTAERSDEPKVDAALRYLKRGWSPIPQVPGEK